jgi:hypothetical protein
MSNQIKIVWPSTPKESMALFLSFQIKVLCELKITFESSSADPVKIANNYIDGEITFSEYESEAKKCWVFLDNSGQLRNFEDTEPLMARLAICLLNNRLIESDLSESVEWFFELLNMLGKDTEVARTIMHNHFDVRSC